MIARTEARAIGSYKTFTYIDCYAETMENLLPRSTHVQHAATTIESYAGVVEGAADQLLLL